jgi:hypothetical protein
VVTDSDAPIKVYSTVDSLGLVPYLLGFHPQDSVVAMLLHEGGRVDCCCRYDIAAPAAHVVTELREVILQRDIASVAIVGYGPMSARALVTQIIDTLNADLPVTGRILVSGGRYYCLRAGCDCTPDEGTPFDPRATAGAAIATMQGKVALPTRDDLLALTNPDPAAQQRTRAAINRLSASSRPVVAELMGLAEQGIRLDDEQIAALAVALRAGPERELAWRATDGEMWQRDLWLDVTRRVPDSHVNRPAALAAWCAWRRGEGTLALAAVCRIQRHQGLDLLAQLSLMLVREHVDPRQFPWPLPAGASLADLLPKR